jgi:hypothetical protein
VHACLCVCIYICVCVCTSCVCVCVHLYMFHGPLPRSSAHAHSPFHPFPPSPDTHAPLHAHLQPHLSDFSASPNRVPATVWLNQRPAAALTSPYQPPANLTHPPSPPSTHPSDHVGPRAQRPRPRHPRGPLLPHLAPAPRAPVRRREGLADAPPRRARRCVRTRVCVCVRCSLAEPPSITPRTVSLGGPPAPRPPPGARPRPPGAGPCETGCTYGSVAPAGRLRVGGGWTCASGVGRCGTVCVCVCVCEVRVRAGQLMPQECPRRFLDKGPMTDATFRRGGESNGQPTCIAHCQKKRTYAKHIARAPKLVCSPPT